MSPKGWERAFGLKITFIEDFGAVFLFFMLLLKGKALCPLGWLRAASGVVSPLGHWQAGAKAGLCCC